MLLLMHACFVFVLNPVVTILLRPNTYIHFHSIMYSVQSHDIMLGTMHTHTLPTVSKTTLDIAEDERRVL